MSHRKLPTDPIAERRIQYAKLEQSGEAQAALWEALEKLASQGTDLGPKSAVVLEKRAAIKARVPKKK